jgi:hypothetical protein
MEGLEKFPQNQNTLKSLGHKVDQEIRSLGVGNGIYGKRKQQGSNRVPAPASSLLDVPARRDDGNDCAFGSTVQSESCYWPPAADIEQAWTEAWFVMELFANGRTHERAWNRPSYNMGPCMRPLPRCHNTSRCQQCPDAHSDLKVGDRLRPC